MKRYEPAHGDGHLEAAVIGRVDHLEIRLDSLAGAQRETATSVEALGRGVATLSATLRSTTGQHDAGGDDQGSAGQRDWLDPALDPETAARWLTGLHAWVTTTLVWLLDRPLPGCWPWHPAAVVDLLNLQDVHAAAYDGQSPVAVADLLGRWLPACLDRVRHQLADCDPANHRTAEDRAAVVDSDRLDQLAHWWAVDRTRNPPGLEERTP